MPEHSFRWYTHPIGPWYVRTAGKCQLCGLRVMKIEGGGERIRRLIDGHFRDAWSTCEEDIVIGVMES